VSAGTFSPGTATCTTDASGTCQVTITSTGPGSATVSAVYTTEIEEVQVSFPALDDAEKTWRTYRVTVTPAADENLLGTPHTFTVTVEETDDGVTWTPVSGVTPVTEVTAPGAIANETCSAGTDAAGQCTVEVTSPTTTTVTLTATYVAVGDDVSAEFTGEGDKTWIDYRVTVSPTTAENLVDTDHVATVTVEIDRADGAGFVPLEGAVPTVDTTGVGQVITDTCADGTAADGTCTVTIRSTTPGTTNVTATYVGTAGDSESADFSDSGSKTWLDYRLTVDPKEATNRLNQPHTFVATLEVDRGDGFGPTSGGVLRVDTTGRGAVVTIDPAGSSNNTCVTDRSGTCRITVNSPADGSLTIMVSYDAVAGDTSRTLTFTAQKSWVGSAIPATGSDSQLLVQIATGVLAAGLLLLLVARRRRNRLAS
jgi:LPXTG-motif cell wall-anchored protein